ncbi:peptidoglycan-associated lipoprotein [Rhodobacter aestuarii]|uniref:Peptidoglycan-associated lipoprotein n=1 Tax=Rhodobacter aestuarii TaxID=453582 RepID=A0A1N7Q5Q6_9RHOB|nr:MULTISPECIES: peptidoglycan-associated lipoprotein Pal [Rhodobacter]PTV93869.1 peptidoglycan-associated lipoprotein [Rhodobacter aestuarii]SIT18198.1 peptidoglycan-associated lipoprotein [Rhodobacter aestuarii]SOC15653.1 peptidoglycan-associated lipoprotein [Rhodobacter sp. JA431]
MQLLTKAALGLALVALAACNNPQGMGGVNDPGGAFGEGGISQGALNDPNSPAYFSATVGDTVNFLVDQSTLSDGARTTLAGQAQWLNAHPNYAAIIEGHADEQGTREYNLALGARRASAVQEYLISQGVAATRLRTVSYGKERPLAVCSTEECYYKNRRAVTVISIGAGS